MTGHQEEVNQSSVYAYQLKNMSEFILIKLCQIELGESPDASFSVIQQRLIELSVELRQPGEDILKSLAHHLVEVQSAKKKSTIEFMRSLVRELFELYQLGKITYNITSSEPKEKEGHNPISRLSGCEKLHLFMT